MTAEMPLIDKVRLYVLVNVTMITLVEMQRESGGYHQDSRRGTGIGGLVNPGCPQNAVDRREYPKIERLSAPQTFPHRPLTTACGG